MFVSESSKMEMIKTFLNMKNKNTKESMSEFTEFDNMSVADFEAMLQAMEDILGAYKGKTIIHNDVHSRNDAIKVMRGHPLFESDNRPDPKPVNIQSA